MYVVLLSSANWSKLYLARSCSNKARVTFFFQVFIFKVIMVWHVVLICREPVVFTTVLICLPEGMHAVLATPCCELQCTCVGALTCSTVPWDCRAHALFHWFHQSKTLKKTKINKVKISRYIYIYITISFYMKLIYIWYIQGNLDKPGIMWYMLCFLMFCVSSQLVTTQIHQWKIQAPLLADSWLERTCSLALWALFPNSLLDALDSPHGRETAETSHAQLAVAAAASQITEHRLDGSFSEPPWMPERTEALLMGTMRNTWMRTRSQHGRTIYIF